MVADDADLEEHQEMDKQVHMFAELVSVKKNLYEI